MFHAVSLEVKHITRTKVGFKDKVGMQLLKMSHEKDKAGFFGHVRLTKVSSIKLFYFSRVYHCVKLAMLHASIVQTFHNRFY